MPVHILSSRHADSQQGLYGEVQFVHPEDSHDGSELKLQQIPESSDGLFGITQKVVFLAIIVGLVGLVWRSQRGAVATPSKFPA